MHNQLPNCTAVSLNLIIQRKSNNVMLQKLYQILRPVHSELRQPMVCIDIFSIDIL